MTSPTKIVHVTGYQHRGYALSLSESGRPIELHHSQGWFLKRQIPGCDYQDAAGCYPLFACQHWEQLHRDLDNLGEDLVSISMVTDPFGIYDAAFLHRCFGDVVFAFKQHFVIDLRHSIDTFVSKHHRRNAGKALRQVTVEQCAHPSESLDDWVILYASLVKRHRIQGMAAFSRASFARQLQVPGMVVFRAIHDGVTVGMLLWYVQGEVAYYHLGATNELGYSLCAPFALFARAIEQFAEDDLVWLNLGASGGVNSRGTDGLARFKQGWSNCTRTAYFCGRILNRRRYLQIVQSKNISTTKYFPAYRLGEFQ